VNRRAKGCSLDRGRHRYTPLRIARMRGIVASSSAGSFSIEKFAAPVMNQTDFGCCEGTSSSGATVTRFAARGTPLGYIPSQNGLYVPARAFDRAQEHPSGELPPLRDVGTETNSVIRVISEVGIVPMGPSPAGLFCDVTRANVNEEIDLGDLERAGTSLIIGAYQINSSGPQKLQDIKDCIVSGVPVRVDSFVDMRFEDWQKGQAPIGAPDYSDPQGGGHALYAIGFAGNAVVVRNSWGESWGDGGNILVSPAWIAQCDAYAWDVQKAVAA
jgi:hypothetical protein